MEPGTDESGVVGLNIHRSSASRTSTKIGKFSAGCQVLANPDEFDLLVSLCDRAAELYGPRFTYTLTDTASGFMANLWEYGAMGLFCSYLVVSNWFAQKRLDRVMAKSENLAGVIAEQLNDQNSKLNQIIEAKKEENLKKDLARMIEDADRT